MGIGGGSSATNIAKAQDAAMLMISIQTIPAGGRRSVEVLHELLISVAHDVGMYEVALSYPGGFRMKSTSIKATSVQHQAVIERRADEGMLRLVERALVELLGPPVEVLDGMVAGDG